jgi:hypothetical protein
MPTGPTATLPQPPETGVPAYVYDVFVSCSEKDEAWARSELIQPMRDSRLRVFDEILFGVPQSVVQERSVAQSRYVLVILTEDWCRSFEKQADLLLVAMADPDASQGRLVPILVKPCDPPPRIKLLTKADFTDPLKRPDVLKSLLRQLGCSERDLNEVTAKSAKKGLHALIELMQQEKVRTETSGAVEAFQEGSTHLDILNRYKELHDEFQKTESAYSRVRKEKHKISISGEGWEDLEAEANDFDVKTEGLLVVARRNFPAEEILWADGLEQDKLALLQAIQKSDLDSLNGALQSLQPTIIGEPSKVDREMVRIAQQLPLSKIVKKLDAVHQTVTNFQFDDRATACLTEFRNGIDSLAKLQLSLTALINNHRCLQQINDLLALLDAAIKLTVDQIARSWTTLPKLLKVLSPDAGGDWLVPVGNASSALDGALKRLREQPADDAAKSCIRNYNDFRNKLKLSFNLVDVDLKRFIGELRRQLGETLHDALGKMQHE